MIEGSPLACGRFVVLTDARGLGLEPGRARMEIRLAQPTLLLTAAAFFFALPAIGLPPCRSLVRRGQPILRSAEVGVPLLEPRRPLLKILRRSRDLAGTSVKLGLQGLERRSVRRERAPLTLQARSVRLELFFPRL